VLRNNMDSVQKMISPQGYFPGNPHYPLLIYKQALPVIDPPAAIQSRLAHNNWSHSWIDSIYDFHHYHSNTYEVLVIISGQCQVQFGGENGPIDTIHQGDVVILPAGVAHKSLTMSTDFQCVGAYPFDIGTDMNYGLKEEFQQALEQIKQVRLPEKDPIFGKQGLLFNYWK